MVECLDQMIMASNALPRHFILLDVYVSRPPHRANRIMFRARNVNLLELKMISQHMSNLLVYLLDRLVGIHDQDSIGMAPGLSEESLAHAGVKIGAAAFHAVGRPGEPREG